MERAPVSEDRGFHMIWDVTGDKTLQDAVQKGFMTQDDQDLINQYIADKQAERPIGELRGKNLKVALRNWSEHFDQPFRASAIEDVYAAILKLEGAKVDGTHPMIRKKSGSPRFGKTSIRDHRRELKAFLTWLDETRRNTNLDPRKIAKIKVTPAENGTFEATDLLQPEEVEAMIRACENSRDRAIIGLLYEAALRPVEIGRLKWSNIAWEKDGIHVTTKEKTGRHRNIFCRWCVPYVAQWRNDCPYDTQGRNALVFCSLQPQNGRYLPLRDDSLRAQLKRIASRAGIRRYRKPYQFRHTRTTDLLNAGIPESHVMQLTHGGRTTMLSVYAHITNSDATRSLKKLHGIEVPEDAGRKQLEPRQCQYCSKINPADAGFCGGCGKPLTVEAATDVTKAENLFQKLSVGAPEEVRREIWEEMERIIKAKLYLD